MSLECWLSVGECRMCPPGGIPILCVLPTPEGGRVRTGTASVGDREIVDSISGSGNSASEVDRDL